MYTINMQGEAIREVTHAKHFGVTIDQHLHILHGQNILNKLPVRLTK